MNVYEDFKKRTLDTIDTKVWTWGHSRKGHLGVPGVDVIYTPTILEALSEKNIVQISAGETHCAALSANHEVYLWGSSPGPGKSKHKHWLFPLL